MKQPCYLRHTHLRVLRKRLCNALHPLYARLFSRTMHQEHASAHEPRMKHLGGEDSLAVLLQHCTPSLR